MPNVSDWHRKQRKKELQKNKTTRIASRDEKVKSEKTEQMVMEEIRKLEKQHKSIETRPHVIQSKIDRLNKELKILKEENSNYAVAKPSKPPSNEPVFTPLARPELSVYYDPKLNPFGEPPPGRPRLFHRRDGGVTMHLEEAGLPGESIPPPPPPPPPRREAVPVRTPRQSVKHPFPEKKVDARRQAPPPMNPETTKDKKIDPSCIPELPKPSAAVNRSKRKLQCDIWASNEEVEYEDATGTGLEGVVTTADTWWYLDTSSQVQGPFPLNQMKQWIQAGFFPSATKIRSSDDEAWKRISKHSVFKALLPESMRQTPNARELESEKIQQSAVQDRIAALRQQTQSEQQAAVSEDRPSAKVAFREHEHDGNEMVDDEIPDDEEDNSVQRRIAALRAESVQNEVVPNSGGSDDESETSVQRRIAALRSGFGRDSTEEQSKLPVQDVIHSVDHITEQQPMYPLDAYAESPPSPRGDEMNAYGPPPAYPQNDYASHDEAVNEVNELPPAYPVDELDEMVPSYPLDMDYPATGEYPVSETYPGSYPIDDEEEKPMQLESPGDVERPRKIVKVDKELVAFMPSHLQKKRHMKAKR